MMLSNISPNLGKIFKFLMHLKYEYIKSNPFYLNEISFQYAIFYGYSKSQCIKAFDIALYKSLCRIKIIMINV